MMVFHKMVKLNLVVDVFSESTTEEEINVYKRYTDEPDKVIVVGGKGNKNKIGGSKIKVVVNQKVGSGIGNSTKCALRTDSSWPTDTDIITVSYTHLTLPTKA